MGGIEKELAELEALDEQLRAFGIQDWCEYDLGIVRGLAYYTLANGKIVEIASAAARSSFAIGCMSSW